MNALAVLALVTQAVKPIAQIAAALKEVNDMITQASAESRDLSDDEVGRIKALMAAGDDAWQRHLQRLREPGAEGETQG